MILMIMVTRALFRDKIDAYRCVSSIPGGVYDGSSRTSLLLGGLRGEPQNPGGFPRPFLFQGLLEGLHGLVVRLHVGDEVRQQPFDLRRCHPVSQRRQEAL